MFKISLFVMSLLRFYCYEVWYWGHIINENFIVSSFHSSIWLKRVKFMSTGSLVSIKLVHNLCVFWRWPTFYIFMCCIYNSFCLSLYACLWLPALKYHMFNLSNPKICKVNLPILFLVAWRLKMMIDWMYRFKEWSVVSSESMECCVWCSVQIWYLFQ